MPVTLAAIVGTSAVTAELTAEKGLSVTVRGFSNAVLRTREAVEADVVDEVYISVTEALQCGLQVTCGLSS